MDGSRPAAGQHGPRVLIVGCGGVGGVVSAMLLEQGTHVTPLTRNAHIADAVNTHGFRLRGADCPGTVEGRAVGRVRRDERFDFILLCTQPTEVEEAARQTVPHLAPDGLMVCLQNGLCEARIATIAGAERTAGAIVAWGASMVEPGIYDRTSAGGFVLGRYAPLAAATASDDPQLETLGRLLECIGPVSVTRNLAGARWSKLALNCAVSGIGTVGGDRLGALLRQRYVRRLALEVMTEAVAVARAEGVKLEKVAGTLDLEWIALRDDERTQTVGSASLVAKHALLLAVGARYRRLRSSMLAAIERGKPPAIDFLNGEVADRAARFGISAPINGAVRDAIRLIARRKSQPSHATLRALFDATRAVATAPRPAFQPADERAVIAAASDAPPWSQHAPPGDTSSAGAALGSAPAPEDPAPEDPAPEASAAETSAAEASAPETSPPEAGAPEASPPDASAPEADVPGPTATDAAPAAPDDQPRS